MVGICSMFWTEGLSILWTDPTHPISLFRCRGGYPDRHFLDIIACSQAHHHSFRKVSVPGCVIPQTRERIWSWMRLHKDGSHAATPHRVCGEYRHLDGPVRSLDYRLCACRSSLIYNISWSKHVSCMFSRQMRFTWCPVFHLAHSTVTPFLQT